MADESELPWTSDVPDAGPDEVVQADDGTPGHPLMLAYANEPKPYRSETTDD